MRLLILSFIAIVFVYPVIADDIAQDTANPQYQPQPDSFSVEFDKDPFGDFSLEDSILYVYPDVQLDTLNEAQRRLIEFEMRHEMSREEREAARAVKDELSVRDSLVHAWIGGHRNLRTSIDRSYYNDAGDYAKFLPQYFLIDYQITPMRKTIQPYGLTGSRMGFLIDGTSMDPFEHILQPDGMTDLNDIPTALNEEVALVPGPLGMALGTQHATASLITRPIQPVENRATSSFLVDLGSYDYSYARGRLTRKFTSGKRVSMSIGYRNADGIGLTHSDDLYHYTADVYLPVGRDQAVRLIGRLYNRNSPYLIRPDIGGRAVQRDRTDEQVGVEFLSHDTLHTSKESLRYTYKRQGSRWDNTYHARFLLTTHGLTARREWLHGPYLFEINADAQHQEWSDFDLAFDRVQAAVGGTFAYRGTRWNWILSGKQNWVESLRFLPQGSAVLQYSSGQLVWMLSASYSERPPSLHEWHLPRQEAAIYSSSIDYVDQGNRWLESEKQLMAATELTYGLGSYGVSVDVAAGTFKDAIEWKPTYEESYTEFSPENVDYEFASVEGTAHAALFGFLTAQGGASYHWQSRDNQPYFPEYQLFGGGEARWLWKSKRIELRAYGEIMYVPYYRGCFEQNLGGQPLINTRLTFKMGTFEFHYIVRNAFTTAMSWRDDFGQSGRTIQYGFTWHFLD